MGQLLVRDLDDEVIQRLKKRAALNGRSTEAEHRAILEEAVRPSAEALLDAARRFQAEATADDDGAELVRRFRDERAARGSGH